MQATVSLQRNQEQGRHPARELMQSQYGLHPELALAVLKHSRVVPWWALLALAAVTLVCGCVFTLAIVDPQNTAFQNESVGGVGPMHYIVLPLMGLLFLAALIYMIVLFGDFRASEFIYVQF